MTDEIDPAWFVGTMYEGLEHLIKPRPGWTGWDTREADMELHRRLCKALSLENPTTVEDFHGWRYIHRRCPPRRPSKEHLKEAGLPPWYYEEGLKNTKHKSAPEAYRELQERGEVE